MPLVPNCGDCAERGIVCHLKRGADNVPRRRIINHFTNHDPRVLIQKAREYYSFVQPDWPGKVFDALDLLLEEWQSCFCGAPGQFGL